MEQSSLFDSVSVARASIAFAPDFSSWLVAARRALADERPPAEVWWTPQSHLAFESAGRLSAVEQALAADGKFAECYRHDDRWSLLYQLFWRLHRGEAHVLDLAADPDVARLHRYAKAVRRDRHKMRAFVRFREVNDGHDEPRYVAWFEPDHLILRLSAPFFKRRFTAMRWSILTPDGSAHWEGDGEVWFSPGVDKSSAPTADTFEDAWRVYYRSIFNPARLKVNAMRAEMPQKYWKNLPEAHEIGSLIRDADRRVEVMRANVKDKDTLRCGPRPASPQQLLEAEQQQAPVGTIHALRLAADACNACPLAAAATQTVFGEGPEDARIMLVGEQPGDAEDLAGRPFVGPAGQLLDRAIAAAGGAREALYVTNAVKHFGFTQRGRRRLHKTPTIQTVHACMQWLRQEMAIVDPEIIVALGRTAATAVLGRPVRVMQERGHLIEHAGRRVLVTVHPSYLLRLPKGAGRRDACLAFRDDLEIAFQEVA
ncbi:MAG: UdgX family uracil-DNA binding protein [Pseudomonadota bacterium]